MSSFSSLDITDGPVKKPNLVPGASPLWKWRVPPEWRQEEFPPEERMATPIDGSMQTERAGEMIIQVLE